MDKKEQEKLLIEIMEADAKDGLYDHIGDTNKMVTMKLYTEEQVRILLDKMSLVTERKNLGVSANFRHRAIEIDNLIKSETPIELPSDEEIIGRFMNWFLKHYSTATIDGFFGYVNSLEEKVSIKEILDDYFTKNK